MARDGIYDRWLELHNWLTDEGASDRVLQGWQQLWDATEGGEVKALEICEAICTSADANGERVAVRAA